MSPLEISLPPSNVLVYVVSQTGDRSITYGAPLQQIYSHCLCTSELDCCNNAVVTEFPVHSEAEVVTRCTTSLSRIFYCEARELVLSVLQKLVEDYGWRFRSIALNT